MANLYRPSHNSGGARGQAPPPPPWRHAPPDRISINCPECKAEHVTTADVTNMHAVIADLTHWHLVHWIEEHWHLLCALRRRVNYNERT